MPPKTPRVSDRNPAASPPLRIVDVRSLVFRAPLVDPVRTSFGMMYLSRRLHALAT